MSDATSDEFYILSLPWTRGDILTWWCPNNSGYTTFLAQAGRYTRAQVEAQPGYYNNGERTFAVPCDEVDALAERVVMGHAGVLAKLTGKRFRMTDSREPGDLTCESCGCEGHPIKLGLEVAGDAEPEHVPAKASA